MTTNALAAQGSLAAALRQILNQLSRILEEGDPTPLLRSGGAFDVALESWRRVIADQTSGLSVQEKSELEHARLELTAKVAVLEKEGTDLRNRNQELLQEIIRLNQREEGARKQFLEAQMAAQSHRADAKRLDLEIRDLRHRIRELEGGPRLTPAEAAPQSVPEPQPVAPSPSEPPPPKPRPASPDARSAAEEAFRAIWKAPPAPSVSDAGATAAGAEPQPAPARKPRRARRAEEPAAEEAAAKAPAKAAAKARAKPAPKPAAKRGRKAPAKGPSTPASKSPAKTKKEPAPRQKAARTGRSPAPSGGSKTKRASHQAR